MLQHNINIDLIIIYKSHLKYLLTVLIFNKLQGRICYVFMHCSTNTADQLFQQ
jgi:hypothetical protein